MPFDFMDRSLLVGSVVFALVIYSMSHLLAHSTFSNEHIYFLMS